MYFRYELPEEFVSANVFETIYEWMLAPPDQCVEFITRDNILQVSYVHICKSKF